MLSVKSKAKTTNSEQTKRGNEMAMAKKAPAKKAKTMKKEVYKSPAAKKKHESKESSKMKAMEKKMGMPS